MIVTAKSSYNDVVAEEKIKMIDNMDEQILD